MPARYAEPTTSSPAAGVESFPAYDLQQAAAVAASADLGSTLLHALSLRRLEQRLTDCGRGGGCPEEALQLDGLTILDGYLTDPRDHDVILLGRSDPDRPPLHVEDFAVALRSAWGKYDERRGTIIYTSDPGCSIDPDPAVIRELEGLAGRIFASGSDDGLEAWNRVCRKPQTVRVMGVPFDTRFAKVMVEADYDMKSQVDGRDPLELPGFASLADMTLKHARRQVIAGRADSLALSTMNRFWFYPGESRFEEHQGVVLIRQLPVTLLSHQTYVNAAGEIADAASSRDPLAELFAANFTRLFDQIAEVRPIYQELEGLFRFVAVARLLELKVRDSPLAGALDYLLESFPVTRTRVDRQKPGQANAKGFDHRTRVPGEEQIFSLRLPSCGGVGMPIEVGADRIRHPSRSPLEDVGVAILNGKDRTDDFTWTVRDLAGGSVNDLILSLKAGEANRHIPGDGIFFARDSSGEGQSALYTLSRGIEDPIYKGDSVHGLFDAMLASGATGTVFLHRDMSTLDHDAAFDSTLRARLLRTKGIKIYLIEEWGDIATRAGSTRIEEVGPPNEVTSGSRRGMFQGTIRVEHSVGQKVKRFLITIYAKSAEIVRAFIAALQSLLNRPTTVPLSLPELILMALQDAQRNLPFTEDELEIMIEELLEAETASVRPIEERRAA